MWLPPTPLAQAQVFPRPDTLCDCGVGYFFFASKRGERKVRKGAPAAPGNYYGSSSPTQESKQFLESTFVKRQLQGRKINGHECQQLAGVPPPHGLVLLRSVFLFFLLRAPGLTSQNSPLTVSETEVLSLISKNSAFLGRKRWGT